MRTQAVEGEGALRVEYQCSFDHVLQFPDVAGPAITHGPINGARGNGGDGRKF